MITIKLREAVAADSEFVFKLQADELRAAVLAHPRWLSRRSRLSARVVGPLKPMSKIDVLIAIPALPVVPVLATWWLPWEKWIPRWKFPKLLVGPYVLYLSFAAWHFRFPWWIVMLLVGGGLVLVLTGLEEKYGRDRPDN